MLHPQPDSNGKPVTISHPSQPTASATWEDWAAVATCVPAGAVPATLNGLPAEALRARRGALDWAHHAQVQAFEEPVFSVPPGYQAAAGAVHWLDTPLLGISGTLLRARRRVGGSLRFLVPDAVLAYIESAGLYARD